MPHSDSGTTAALLSAVEQGKHGAVNQLLSHHRDYLKRVVDARMEPSLRGRIDPSDVVQETLTVANLRLNDFLERRPSSFRIWLRRKALEQLIDQRRFHRRRRRNVANEIALSDGSSLAIAIGIGSGSVSRNSMLSELMVQVRAAMQLLSDTDREVLLLRHAEELNNAECAEVLELEPKAASARYGRAVLRLSSELRRQGLCGE